MATIDVVVRADDGSTRKSYPPCRCPLVRRHHSVRARASDCHCRVGQVHRKRRPTSTLTSKWAIPAPADCHPFRVSFPDRNSNSILSGTISFVDLHPNLHVTVGRLVGMPTKARENDGGSGRLDSAKGMEMNYRAHRQTHCKVKSGKANCLWSRRTDNCHLTKGGMTTCGQWLG